MIEMYFEMKNVVLKDIHTDRVKLNKLTKLSYCYTVFKKKITITLCIRAYFKYQFYDYYQRPEYYRKGISAYLPKLQGSNITSV